VYLGIKISEKKCFPKITMVFSEILEKFQEKNGFIPEKLKNCMKK